MSWKQCQIEREIKQTGARFEWPSMENFDCLPGIAYADVMGFLGWLLHWPGDYALSHPAVRRFTGMHEEIIVGHGFSAAVVILLAILLSVFLAQAFR
ncbi:hypothetical protein [Brevirhabdus sp.]|uniref:hypothetical protein n=1 Tax=Brevirhabdus sp. TaxID=2004514 RepID=UPI00405975FA